MFFNKATQQAFVFPPKTGTISIRHFLGAVGWNGIRPYHETPEQLIGKYPALNSYNIYGFFRNPLQRFESAILHVKQVPVVRDMFAELLAAKNISKTIELVTYEELIGVHDALADRFRGLFFPQVHWFDHPKVIALDFCNMEFELRRITGNTTQEFKRWNVSSDFGRSVITPAVEEFVRQQYADDYKFAKDILGKEF